MEKYIDLFLFIYFMAFFINTFIIRSFLISKRINKNPIVLNKSDKIRVYGFFVWIFLYITLYAFVPVIWRYFLPIEILDMSIVQYAWIVILIFAYILTTIAQSHMKDSWRVGIDTDTETELITTGVFRYSGNPIFLWMILSMVGLFLVTPNIISLTSLITGSILIQIQVRLEENFLEKQYGTKYREYKSSVRRFL